MNIISSEQTYNVICDKLEKKKPFTFTRFGDGEWNAIFNKEGVNGDKHTYFPNMGKKLKDVVTKKRPSNYIYGLQPLANNKMGSKIKNTSDKNIKWYNADCLADASIKNKINRYFKAIQNNRLIMVAPSYLKNFEKYDEFVEVPLKNCWLKKDKIINEIITHLGEKHTIVSVTASMAANVIIDKLYKLYGNKHTFIDAGSVYDPYVGVKTRKYHDKILKRLNN